MENRHLKTLIVTLLEEVSFSHRDKESPDYNECEKHQCEWCRLAKIATDALSAPPTEIVDLSHEITFADGMDDDSPNHLSERIEELKAHGFQREEPCAALPAGEPPDKYCITQPDGSCISDDPRCMHNKPAPQTKDHDVLPSTMPVTQTIIEDDCYADGTHVTRIVRDDRRGGQATMSEWPELSGAWTNKYDSRAREEEARARASSMGNSALSQLLEQARDDRQSVRDDAVAQLRAILLARDRAATTPPADALREALSWALDMIDMYDERLAGIDGRERVYSTVHLAGKAKARAALAAPAAEPPREPDGWMNVEQAGRLQQGNAITGTVHRVPPTGEQYVSVWFGAAGPSGAAAPTPEAPHIMKCIRCGVAFRCDVYPEGPVDDCPDCGAPMVLVQQKHIDALERAQLVKEKE